MPFGSEAVEPGIALALSGGGFRATLFHIGSLWRLNEMGYLSRMDRISSVSGGSITAGVLGLHWNTLNLATGVALNFKEVIVSPLRDFCSRSIDGPAIGEGALLPWKSVSDAVQEEYDEHLFFRKQRFRDFRTNQGSSSTQQTFKPETVSVFPSRMPAIIDLGYFVTLPSV